MTNNSNVNQFARFASTSPLSSIPHDPVVTLASNCIRDFFGPTVQLVADALISRSGGSTLADITAIIKTKAYVSAQRSDERRKIMRLGDMRSSAINSKSNNGDRPSHASVRASLLALIQHSVVKVKKRTRTITSNKKNRHGASRKKTTHLYEIDTDRARLFPRYPRLVAFIKKLQDETAATLVEEILVQGRARTVQAIVSTVEQIQQQQEDDKGEPSSTTRSDHRYTSRQAVMESFLRLTRGGFIEQVTDIAEINEDNDEGETEFEGPGSTEKKNSEEDISDEDPTVVSLLRSGPYKNLPPMAVWRVNIDMFHEHLRAVSLGWLVAERYNHKIQSSGSIVTAALKLAASHRYGNASLKSSSKTAGGNRGTSAAAAIDFESIHNFSVEKILRFLPKTVVQNFEKREGGVIPNIYKALVDLTRVSNPVVVEEVEVAPGQPGQCKFQIQTRRLVEYLRDRIVHQIILDTHGEVAARICPILRFNGYMESDQVAESAMVPAKDTRELLHRLYRDKYIQLFNINQGKQHNPSNMIYLWGYSRPRGTRTAAENVCIALCNMRLRRQHEVEVGKDWIERAKEAGATDENENEVDKLMFSRFCQGLERLDNATLQLDETLMALKDY
mmetsp:Transcript_15815/g.36620  ORF Transcript_15815/g.36620 Transcript_15815/m.36620 type:complete len:618 (-) Transcript_15815:61-1914(-)|eukprot:CAMPEP_0197188182 /NCGR_PEP_ID=MMETSP1423-20130617/17402_1 /TAXON_ID=476441 /ORGANISM="Pseudo-nitzschia heimii, Strain UNC1101" /LENGTH=617 /DNA_ID=CAMNT_0042639965 /DNA_START=64 /DNA_END=1920 /DNA_ORIENTATION=+